VNTPAAKQPGETIVIAIAGRPNAGK